MPKEEAAERSVPVALHICLVGELLALLALTLQADIVHRHILLLGQQDIGLHRILHRTDPGDVRDGLLELATGALGTVVRPTAAAPATAALYTSL